MHSVLITNVVALKFTNDTDFPKLVDMNKCFTHRLSFKFSVLYLLWDKQNPYFQSEVYETILRTKFIQSISWHFALKIQCEFHLLE